MSAAGVDREQFTASYIDNRVPIPSPSPLPAINSSLSFRANSTTSSDTLKDFHQVNIHDLRNESRIQETFEPLLSDSDEIKRAKRLESRLYPKLLRCLLDVSIAVLPCLFIALGSIAAHLDGRELSSLGRTVENAARLGPTIYPIVFAAVTARLLRHVARWQAERGQRLGILEQLVNSQSLAGALTAAISLRSLSLTSLAITLLWTLSPIGGQSSLRLISITEASVQTQEQVYAPIGETVRYFGGASHYTNVRNIVNALFSASLLAPNATWNAPIDTWGNAKIPSASYISHLSQNVTDQRPATVWHDVESPIAKTRFSSLIGVPLWGVPLQGDAIFPIQWPIVDADCRWQQPGFTEREWCEISNNYMTPDVYGLRGSGNCTWNETSETAVGTLYDGGSVLTSMFLRNVSGNSMQLNSNSAPAYVDIMYSVYDFHRVDNVTYYSSNYVCDLKTTRAELEVSCAEGACRIFRMRKSNDSRPDFLSIWNDASIMPDNEIFKLMIFSTLLSYLPATTGASIYGYSNAFDIFLNGIDQPFVAGGSGRILNWTNVSEKAFSERFAQLYNTFYIASQWSTTIGDKTDLNITEIRNSTTGEPQPDFQQALAVVTNKYAVYKANYVWIILLIGVSIILLLCALLSLVLRLFIVAPDILGFVSSLTRDNVYFPLALQGGSILDGEERALILRNLRVHIADVRPNDDIGHIAFTVVEEKDSVAVKLKEKRGKIMKGRLYD